MKNKLCQEYLKMKEKNLMNNLINKKNKQNN